jgi:hypothetical protein
VQQQSLFHEDIYEALATDIQSLGGKKTVGSLLWPEKSPDKAGELVANCLSRSRPEKLDPEQVIFIINRARQIKSAASINFIASTTDYETPRPIEPEDEMAKLQREFIQMAKVQQVALQKIEHMSQLRSNKEQ